MSGVSPEMKVEIKPAISSKITVAVVAPGAGTGINGAIYSELGRNPSFKVEVVGRSRAPYDVYPPCWPHGAPAPNLQSFADEVLETGVHREVQTMVFGSRGGQVVLPHLWQAQEHGLCPPVPPVVVINGGCAMKLPTPVRWPESAVSFLLIGGQDNFRGRLSVEDYVAETRSHVPLANKTTAILFVQEMTHMPQQPLLRGVLRLMLKAIASWKEHQKGEATCAQTLQTVHCRTVGVGGCSTRPQPEVGKTSSSARWTSTSCRWMALHMLWMSLWPPSSLRPRMRSRPFGAPRWLRPPATVAPQSRQLPKEPSPRPHGLCQPCRFLVLQRACKCHVPLATGPSAWQLRKRHRFLERWACLVA